MLSGSLRPVTPAPGNPGDPGGPEDPGDPLSLDISQLVLAKLDIDQCDVETGAGGPDIKVQPQWSQAHCLVPLW